MRRQSRKLLGVVSKSKFRNYKYALCPVASRSPAANAGLNAVAKNADVLPTHPPA